MAYFIFNGISSEDMPVRVLDMFFPSAAKQQSETISVPGRSEPIIQFKDRYENITGKIVAEFKKDADFREIFSWLSGSGKLTTSDEPDKYYKAVSVKEIAGKRINGIYRSVTLQFTCSPFVYALESEPIPIGTSYTPIQNPGTIYSEPVITFKVTADEAPVLKGDVNFDGVVDARDASMVISEYSAVQAGGEGTFSDAQKAAADMNEDGIIDVRDASLILSAYSNSQSGSAAKDDVEKQCQIDVNGGVMVIGLPSAAVRNGYTVTMDCSDKLLYYTNSDGEKVNILQYSYGDFPLLHTGTNYAKYSGDISDVKITVNERWR